MRKRVPLGDLFNIPVGIGQPIYTGAAGQQAEPVTSQAGVVEVAGAFDAGGNLSMTITRNGQTLPPVTLGAVTASVPFSFPIRLGKGDSLELALSAAANLLLLSSDQITD